MSRGIRGAITAPGRDYEIDQISVRRNCAVHGTGRPPLAAPGDVAAAVAAPSRTPDNVKLDESRKPAEVLSFFGLRKGLRVIDMFGANQYWAEIMAPVVGPEGSRHRVAADPVPQRRAPQATSPRSPSGRRMSR